MQGSGMEGLGAYYRMVELARRIQVAGAEESARLCREYIDSVRTLPPGDVYEEASRLFLKGIAAFRLVSAEGNLQMERGLPFWNDELALLGRMCPTARRNFHANLITCLIAAYSSLEDQSGLVHAADGYLAMLDEYYRDPEIVRRRPYISKEMSYLVCYYSMCTSPLLDERNLQAYYERYRRFADSAAADAGNLLTNRQGFYTISAEYYNRRGDYPRALAYLDSLTVQLRPGGVTSQLVAISANKAKILERMGRYKEACGVYNEVVGLRDSLSSHRSHEIRTPLNAISGFAELIAGEDLTEEERREFVQIIRDNTQLFTSLINDMLEVSQLDNTSAELPRKLLDISKIIRAEMEHLPVKEGVEYRLKLAAPEIVFPLHRSYVSLLVRELLKNAVKFTEQGSVTVKCGLTGSDTLTLSVTDTGCGVEPGLAEKIFDRFYKGDPFAQGLGLGLSLCRLIVEKLGGTIALDTSYTGGARFVVTLRDA